MLFQEAIMASNKHIGTLEADWNSGNSKEKPWGNSSSASEIAKVGQKWSC